MSLFIRIVNLICCFNFSLKGEYWKADTEFANEFFFAFKFQLN